MKASVLGQKKSADDKNSLLSVMSVVRKLSEIYMGSEQLSNEEKQILRETIFTGQLTSKGLHVTARKIADGNADEGDLYLAGFFQQEAERYLSHCSAFIHTFEQAVSSCSKVEQG